jgi:hypothetical protein
MGFLGNLFGNNSNPQTDSNSDVESKQLDQDQSAVDKRKSDLEALMVYENKLKKTAATRTVSEVPQEEQHLNDERKENSLSIQNPFRGE